MANVGGIDQVVAALQKRMDQLRASGGKPTAMAVVSFTTNYALYVHENLEAIHPVGQAKFLEQPARQLAPEIAQIVTDSLLAGNSLEQSVILAGLRLQREAQEMCPVDTSALKASAQTELERE